MARNAEEKSNFSRKIDHLCRVIFLTEEGKPKSPTLLYSFCLAIVYFVAALVFYLFLIDVLESALAECSAAVRNLAEIIVPGAAAALPCGAISLLFRERKNVPPAAYAWLGLLLVMMALVMIPYCEDLTDYRLFWEVLGFPMLATVICGGGLTYFIYRRRK